MTCSRGARAVAGLTGVVGAATEVAVQAWTTASKSRRMEAASSSVDVGVCHSSAATVAAVSSVSAVVVLSRFCAFEITACAWMSPAAAVQASAVAARHDSRLAGCDHLHPKSFAASRRASSRNPTSDLDGLAVPFRVRGCAAARLRLGHCKILRCGLQRGVGRADRGVVATLRRHALLAWAL